MQSLAALEVGAEFAGRYRVVRCLKHGGMGSVFEVLDQRTDRRRALKVMQAEVATDPDMRARFEKEASIVGRVRSDHIVEVVDAGICEPDTPFLVMELLDGQDLSALVEARGALASAEALELLGQVARGLDKVHEEGVVHRDLKPENLFASRRDDGSPNVKILDFGVAKVVHHTGNLSTTRSLGTPLYMAPEQLTGDGTIGPAADLYALAHVAFFLLTGKPYWQEEARSASNAYSFMNVVLRGPSERASVRASRAGVTLPSGFDRWFARATASKPSRRFESAAEQIAALRSVLDGAVPAADGAPVPEPPRPRRSLYVAAGAVAVGVVGALVASSSSGEGTAKEMPASPPAATEPSAPAAPPSVADRTSAPRAPATVAASSIPVTSGSGDVVRASSSEARSAMPARSAARAAPPPPTASAAPAVKTAPSSAPSSARDPLDAY